ncbi:hypothetical protein [Moorena sp. SIO3H5]|nr:hypothetical protein [Moorena sp. SIO3H5]
MLKVEYFLLLSIPDSRFPIPDSRFPIPDSLLPIKDTINHLFHLLSN